MADKDKPFEQILIVGCGDIGLRVAKLWQNFAVNITAIARTADTLSKLAQYHIHTLQVDLDDVESLKLLPTKNALIYYFAPPPAKGTEDSRMDHFLAAIETTHLPVRVIYISTSGVYGDRQGQLINEATPVNPQVDRAKRRYHAEQLLTQWSKTREIPITILRVGGIYGPNRLPLQRIKDHIPMVFEHLAPQTNRIHADDLAQVCVAAALKGKGSQIFNVSDGSNSNMTEYFNTIADVMGLERPPLVDWDQAEKEISAGMLSYLKESRRMDNTKMLRELEITLQYPTLNEGLKSCL